MQESGQAPELFIFAEMPGQGPHHGLGSQSVLQHMRFGLVCL
jgi:hypothetical protein